jgi:hypothetical protein
VNPDDAEGLPPLDDDAAVVASASAIIDVFDRRPDLYLAAAANPVLALRDAGVRLGPEAERFVERRCRFDPEAAVELDALERRIVDVLGPLDPDDDAAVEAAMRAVGIEMPGDTKSSKRASSRRRPSAVAEQRPRTPGTDPFVRGDTGGSGERTTPRRPPLDRAQRRSVPLRRSAVAAAATLPQVARWRQSRRSGPDPLEAVRDAHDVVPLLIEYRSRSQTQLRFASPELYERLKATTGGQLSEGVNITIRVRLAGDR